MRRGGEMRVRDVALALGRRWWIIVLGLAATAGGIYAVFLYVPATQEITSRVLLLPPKSTVTETGNPYLQLGGLREAVDMLGVSLTDQQTLLGLKQISEDADIEVVADPVASAPILLIKIQDPSPNAAREIRDRLLALVDTRLDGLQQGIGVPVKNRVTSTLVSSDVQAEEVGRDQLRAAVIAGLAGLAATLALAVVLDAAILRRRARRGEASGPAEDSGTPQDASVKAGHAAGPPSPSAESLDDAPAALQDPLDLAGDADTHPVPRGSVSGKGPTSRRPGSVRKPNGVRSKSLEPVLAEASPDGQAADPVG